MTHYWFPAKRCGWGWGLPSAWQGWLVVGAFFVLFMIGWYLWPPKTHLQAFMTYELILSAALVGICWRKGEPPRWRWGK